MALNQNHLSTSCCHHFLHFAFTRDPDITMGSRTEVASDFVQNTLGYSFRNTLLLEEALDTTGLRSPGSNGRLAMIGDSRLKDIILYNWYVSGASKGS